MINNKKSAFTLIELLVVIAIISLLVSILLPSLKKAKDLAISAVCSSQEKMMGTALAMYMNEYSGVYPVAYKTHEILDADRGWVWREAIYNYYGLGDYNALGSVYSPASLDVKIYTCPADTSDLVYKDSSIETKRASYAANVHTSGGTRDGVMGLDYYAAPDYDKKEYRSETYVTDPCGTFVVVDNCVPSQTTGWRHWANSFISEAYWGETSYFTFIHNNGNNYLFCDGHVSWMTLDDTCSDVENITNGIWTPWAD